MAHATHTDILVALGLNLDTVKTKMQEWNVAGKSITLRLASKTFYEFVREGEHTVESPKVKTTTKVLGITSTKETSVVTTVKDYYYKVLEELSYSFLASLSLSLSFLFHKAIYLRCKQNNSCCADNIRLGILSLCRHESC